MTEPVGRDDAALATAVAAGDVDALGEVYDRYASRLLGFCQSMLHDAAAAEDCLQDVFVLAATRLDTLRSPELLRSWLFSVARHECLGRLDRRRREVVVDDVGDRPSADADPAMNGASDTDLADLLRDAQAGMSDRDRLLIELADRQQLAGEDFATAVGVSRATAYTLLARARATAKKSIGALLVARTGRGRCGDLDALLGQWDGALTPLLRKQVARHVEKCSTCDHQRSRVASMAALLGGEGEAFAARLVALRRQILSVAAAAMADGSAAVPNDAWPPPDPEFADAQDSRRRRRLGALLAFALVLLLGGVVAAGAMRPVHTTSGGQAVVPTTVATASTAATTGVAATSFGIVTAAGPPPRNRSHRARHSSPAPRTSTSALPSRSATTSSSPPGTETSSTSSRPSKRPSKHPSRHPSRTPTRTKTSSAPKPPPKTTTPPPPPPPVWVMTVQPNFDVVTVTWDGTTQTCDGSNSPELTCSYKIDDQSPVSIDIGREWRYDSPQTCADTAGADEVCNLTMTADETVAVHVS